ncbi:MAG: hypothetical protein COB76_03190 [Alphaproteobacteria bacterium]|nr:MAG: hypothetical protein COB76_03190 [Alphaproteobacteria bacterium]
MKKQLLLTTALIATIAMPAMAGDAGWLDTMKGSVQTWFGGQAETTPEVEAYLDEVTIAVPPMTGAEAAAIMPAAGDYIEDVNTMIESAPAAVAPGSSLNDETSFNTDFTGTDGSIAALGIDDTMDASDFANIMPASGDAEEVVAESATLTAEATEMATEATEMATEAETVLNEAMEVATEAQEASQDPVAAAMEKIEEIATEKANEEAAQQLENVAPAAGDVMDTAKGMMQ